MVTSSLQQTDYEAESSLVLPTANGGRRRKWAVNGHEVLLGVTNIFNLD